tara:strand:+ start:1110 stop:2105 length:996 start_codon:yes stop_codon:yes gene_type:complete
MKKALFIGTKFGNAYLQYKSLKFFFDDVDIIEPVGSFYKNKFFLKFFYHISSKIFNYLIYSYVLSKVKKKYDLIYVKSGEFLSKELVLKLKEKTNKIVYFCNDNPFVVRDNKRWDLFHPASKLYDLLVFQDKSRINEAKKRGLKNYFLVLPPYNNNIHKINKTKKKSIDVVFVGTWSKQKGNFIYKLIKLGLNIKIYGSNWEKDKNFYFINRYITSGHLNYKNYSRIIKISKIAIALYSDDNKDSITARSLEIPAIGTFLISKKTSSMVNIYKENKEVVFFNSPSECFKKCKFYLKNDKNREAIAKNAQKKVLNNLNASNYDLIKKVLKNI